MELSAQQHTDTWRQPRNWLAFFVYALLLGVSISHHELWGDEIHSWNIAKASPSYPELIRNIRYEGHPPLWYTLMWTLSRFSHNLQHLQLLQYLLACGFSFVFMFKSPFSFWIRCLAPFGYYFLFEYGTLSRNYAGALLLAFLICSLLQRDKRNDVLHYLLLFLLSNTHLLGAVLAASMQCYFLVDLKEKGKSYRAISAHLLLGVAVVLPSLYFIFPPSDSEMNVQFWIDRWNRHQVTDILDAPVKAFVPVPAWWRYHFWNTEVFVNLKSKSVGYALLSYTLSIIIVTLAVMMLRRDRKALWLFLVNLLLTCMVAAIFPLNTERYVGFLYIAFLVALWQYVTVRPLVVWQNRLLALLLLVQISAAVVAVVKDYKFPFSNAGKVNELIAEVPPGQAMVTDYWCLNNIAAFSDRPFYCIELNRELSYILWDQKMAAAMKAETPYCNGFRKYFADTGRASVYLLSSNDAAKLNHMEPALQQQFGVELIDQRVGAIEQYSNIYLYKITNRR